MSSFVRFTSLSGAQDESYLCYLLEIDEARILLDCGWDLKSTYDLETRNIDAILFSHADIQHMGAYVYAFKTFGIRCPVYCSTPIHDMGKILFQEILESKKNQEQFTLFGKEDIDAAFDHMTILRFSQPTKLSGRCNGVVITAFNSGHTLGGTVWKIKKNSEEIIYAVDYNHRKERHLNGTALINTEALFRPSLLITDSLNFASPDLQPRNIMETNFLDAIASVLQIGGNVLIPVDPLRSLELTYLLDSFWSFHSLSFPVVYLSYTAQKTFHVAKSTLEWMGDAIAQAFAARELPFDFRSVKCITSLVELERIPGSRVILCPFPDLEFGFARDLFFELGKDPKNLVLLPEKGAVGTFGRELYDLWESNQSHVTTLDFVREFKAFKRIFLEPEEEQKEKEIEMMYPSDDESSVASEEEYDTFCRDEQKGTSFFKQTNTFNMFPVSEPRVRQDDYGQVLDWTEFTRLETRPEEETKVVIAQVVERPCKYEEMTLEIQFKCKLQYLNMEGRSDGKSMRNVIQQISPKKVILIHGSQGEAFKTEIASLAQEIFLPATNEPIDVSVASNLYQVVLTDSLLASMSIERLGSNEISWLTGVVKERDSRLYLEPINEQELKSHQPLIVGDIKLSSLRTALVQKGYQATFSANGLLHIGRKVVIKKEQDGTIQVYGGLHPEVFEIRQLIHSLQSVVV